MKKQILLSCFVVLMLVASSWATIVVQDDFEDGVLDAAKWQVTSGTVTETGGKLTMSGNWAEVKGYDNATLGAGQEVVLSSSNINMASYSWWNTFGLQNVDDSTHIKLVGRGDGWGGYIAIKYDGGDDQVLQICNTQWMLYGYTITWSQNRVTVVSDVWGTFFDSEVDTTDRDGNAWNIPGVGTSMAVYLNSGASSGSEYDDMKLEVVPEPSTMMILGLGGWLMAIRRKKFFK